MKNIEIFRGDSQKIQIKVLKSGSPYDLTGHSISFKIFKDVDGEPILAVNHSVTESDLPQGVIIFDITKTQSGTLPAASYYYQAILDKDEFRRTIQAGRFNIKPIQ